MGFAQALVKNMGISPSSVNAGIVMFGRTASTQIGLTSNAAALMPHLVNRNGVDTGATNMVAALDHADKMLKRGRSGVPKVVMMLTDGEPNRGGNPDANFAAMKAAGTSVMMVLIGPGISSRRAKNWGSTPPISISSFTALASAFTTISKEFCSVAKEAVIKKARAKAPTSCECFNTPAAPPPATKPPRITKHTFAFGGNGGGVVNSNCADGHYVNWWRVRSGSLVDRIQGRCSNGAWLRACGGSGGGENQRSGVNGAQKMYVRTGALVDQFNGRGGNGGAGHWLDCGSGFKVTGYRTRCGSLVDKVQFECKNV